MAGICPIWPGRSNAAKTSREDALRSVGGRVYGQTAREPFAAGPSRDPTDNLWVDSLWMRARGGGTRNEIAPD